METWYFVNKWDVKVKPIEVIRSTEQSVFTKCSYSSSGETRSAKWSQYGRFFPTREEAAADLRNTLTNSVKYREEELSNAKKRLAEFEASERLEL